MSSKTTILPLIDFSNLKHGSLDWESVKNQLKITLEEYGCFEALYSDISLDLRKSVFDGLQQLFDLPLETKLRNRTAKSYHGYVGQSPMFPLYESMGIENVLEPSRIESFTNRLWSQGNPSFSKSIQVFSEQLSKLDKTVRTMILEILHLEKYMDEHMESANYLVRVQKYEVPHSEQTKIGLPSHKDMNCITILCQNDVMGLEVLTKDDQSIDAKPSPGSFIIMTGEFFHAWTNGRLHSAHHRVTMNGDIARFSFGLFSIPKAGYIIKAPEEMVDEQHPLLFKPYDNAKFLDFYVTEQGQNSPAALKESCGV